MQETVILERLEKIESLLVALVERQQIREFYAIEEFARLVGATGLRSGNGRGMAASGQRRSCPDAVPMPNGLSVTMNC